MPDGRSALDCHPDVVKVREGSRHEKLNCEACHGPLAKHATGDVAAKPPALNPRLLCLRCHTTQAGLPEGFPNVVAERPRGRRAVHGLPQPHHPKIG